MDNTQKDNVKKKPSNVLFFNDKLELLIFPIVSSISNIISIRPNRVLDIDQLEQCKFRLAVFFPVRKDSVVFLTGIPRKP